MANTLTIPVFDKTDQQTFLNQTCKSINPNQRSADKFTSTIAWQIFYARYQSLHLQKYGSYLMPEHRIYQENTSINL